MNLTHTILQLYNTNMRNKPNELETKVNMKTKSTKPAEQSRLGEELMGQLHKK